MLFKIDRVVPGCIHGNARMTGTCCVDSTGIRIVRSLCLALRKEYRMRDYASQGPRGETSYCTVVAIVLGCGSDVVVYEVLP